MKNITFSADDRLIQDAREMARGKHTTLNAEFRNWLEDYAGRKARVRAYEELMKRLDYVDLGGRKFTREEMNERR